MNIFTKYFFILKLLFKDALSYLLPSGLLDERARPKMRVKIKLFNLKIFLILLATGRTISKRKRYFSISIPRSFKLFFFLAVQFDKAGRPYHFLYYTAKQNYYDVLHVRNKRNFSLFLSPFEI
jgi:hypothetical protein